MTLSPSTVRFGLRTEISRPRRRLGGNAAAGKLSGMYEKADAGMAVLTQTCDLIPRRRFLSFLAFLSGSLTTATSNQQ